MYRNLSRYSQLSRGLSRCVARATAVVLILAISGFGSPVFARSLTDGFTAAREQLPRLSSYVYALGIQNWLRSSKVVTQGRGMPPDVPRSIGIRPEPPEDKSQREERVARLEMNLRDVTLKPGELVQLNAVPVDSEGNPVHGVTAEWSSPNSHVATVSEGGEVTAVAAGTAPINATAGRAHATLIVNVVQRGSASGNKESSARNTRQITSGSSIRPQRTTRNSSSLFAHASASAASARPLQIGIIEAEQLYEPNNAIGAPPGRTTPGASTRGTAIETTETPASANFSFDLGVVSLPGRGFDLDFGLTYNSRIWTKSLTTPIQMTYNMDVGWIAPGFIGGYGYLDNQSDASGKQFMITDEKGTRHKMVNIPVGSNTYESDDGSFIKLTVNGTQVTPATAIFPGGMQIRYGIGDTALTTRYHPTQITDRNGNLNTIAYAGSGGAGPKIDSIKDTLARYVRFKYVGNDLIAITAPGLTGQPDRPVIRFYYENISGLNAAGLFQSGIVVNAPSGGTARVVKYIYLASATETANAHIGFRYDYSSYGMMFRITKFHGMTISTAADDYTQAGTVTNEGTVAAQTTYNYHGTPVNQTTNLADAPFYTTRTDDWAGRTSAQPVYNFSVNQTAGLSTVTSPDGTITETQSIVNAGFPDDGLISRTTIKNGSTTVYETAYSWDPSPPGNIQRLLNVKTTNEAAQTKAVVFTYDSSTPYNNISVLSERDLTTNGSVSAVELRRTETTYVTDSNYTSRGLIALPSIVKIFAGGATSPTARTDYFYDQFGLGAASGITMWADPGTIRGNLTKTRGYPDATNTASFIDHTSTYDIGGNKITAQLDCCQQRTFTYSSSFFHAYLTSVTSGTGPTLTTSATYDLPTGLTSISTDENGQQTSFFYFVDSLRLDHIDYADGGRVTYSYNDALTPNASGLHYSSTITTRLDATRSVQSWKFCDGRGEVTQTFDNWTSANGWSTQDIEYNVMGRAFRAGNPYYSSGYSPSNPINPTQFWTTMTFDKLGRVTILTMPSGDSSPSSTTTVQTNYQGTVTTVTDQASKQRRQITDGLGRVIRLHEPNQNGELGEVGMPQQETSYEYDALDNLIHITQGAQQRYFKYDSLGRLTHQRQVEQDAPFTTPDSVAGNNLWSRKLIYNSHGLVTDAYDARQINTHFGYDGLNRISQITYSDGTPTVNYTYDQARTGFFNQGRLTTVTTATAGQTQSTTQEFDHDRLGRVVAQRQKIGITSYSLSYVYNLAGLVERERYPSGRAVKYGYDEGARLSTVTDSAGVSYASGFTYAPHGALTSETFGNSAVHTLDYNSRLQTKQIKLKQNATGPELQRFDYLYGQMTQATGTVDVTKNNDQIGRVDSFTNGVKQWDQRFTYDSLGRLSQAAEYRGDNSQLTWQTHYDYDRYGNRFQYQLNSGVSFTPVAVADVDANRNRFISTGPTPTTYDPAGNILSDAKFRGLSYTYDANNRQKSASGTVVSQSAVYDALGQRVQTSTTTSTRQMVYDAGGQIVAEYEGGILRRENIYRGGQLLGSQEFNTAAPPPQNVVWTNVSPTVQVNGNSINRNGGTNSWYEGGAISSQKIMAGDGYMEFTPGNTSTWRMCGLGNNDTGAYFADIDYALFLGGSGDLHIYEEGIDRNINTTYAANDRLKVAIEGGVVKYYRNSTLIYTSTVAPTYPLQVDASINTAWGSISNVVISGARLTANPVKYVLQDVQSSTRAVMSGTSVVARHDFLPFGEEIGAGTGLRTTSQGFGVTDRIRQRYAMTERDDATFLDHTWWRKYENRSGRWISPDPFLGNMSTADPQSFNRYAYVQNDPVNLIDPTGLWCQWELHRFGVDTGVGDIEWEYEWQWRCYSDPPRPGRGGDGTSGGGGGGGGVGGGGGSGNPGTNPSQNPTPTQQEKTQEQKKKEYDDCYHDMMKEPMRQLDEIMWSNLKLTGLAALGGGVIGSFLQPSLKSTNVWGAASRSLRSMASARVGIGTSLAILPALYSWRRELLKFDRETFTPAMKNAEAECKKKAGL